MNRRTIALATGVGLAALLLWLVWPTRGKGRGSGSGGGDDGDRRSRQAHARRAGSGASALARARAAAKRAAGKDIVLGAQAAAQQFAKGRLVVRAGWGNGKGQLGRRPARESNPESPMGLAVGRDGSLTLVDQVNGRLQRFDKNGRPLGSIDIGTTTAQDVAIDDKGRTLVLDRHTRKDVQIFDKAGKRVGAVPLSGEALKKAGSVTGVFSDDDGVYVEVNNDRLVRISDGAGVPTSGTQFLPGRPTRDKKLLVRAGIVERDKGRMYVQAHYRDSTLAWETPLRMSAPIIEVLMLDSDSAGNVYVAVEIGVIKEGSKHIAQNATVVARLDDSGQLTGSLTLPPTLKDPGETFRPISVSDDGTILQMVATSQGMTVKRYTFDAT